MIKIISVKLNEPELSSTLLELLISDELVELLAITASLDTSPLELDPELEPDEPEPELDEPEEPEPDEPEPEELGAELDEDTSSM